MSAGKVTGVLLVILLLVWLVLLTLGKLGLMPGSTQKYVKDRKWDKMREMLKDLYKADGTEDPTVCKDIRDWWEDNQEDYDDFIAGQEDGDPETLNDWAWGFPVEIEFEDFIEEYFEDVGKELAEGDFLEIAKGISLCENEVDMTTLKDNVVRIITPVADQVDGYDPLAGDCSNVTTEQSVLPNYVWSYDDDTFIDISNLEDDTINSVDWRKKHKMVCTPLAMDEEFIPGIGEIPAKIKFTNVTNPISGTKIEVFEEGQGGLTTGLTHTFSSSTTADFEIPLTAMTTFNKPLYVIKLDGKETDHVFAGNVGTIAFEETTSATDTDSAILNYKKIQFTPNIKIPVGYEIIVEATTVPESTICPTTRVGKEIVAKMGASTTVIDENTVVDLDRGVCYTKDDTKNTAGADTEYVPAEYTAYIRKEKKDSATEENPKYKFATLTKAVST